MRMNRVYPAPFRAISSSHQSVVPSHGMDPFQSHLSTATPQRARAPAASPKRTTHSGPAPRHPGRRGVGARGGGWWKLVRRVWSLYPGYRVVVQLVRRRIAKPVHLHTCTLELQWKWVYGRNKGVWGWHVCCTYSA